MLYVLGDLLSGVFGPFRLFTSHLLLAGVGGALAAWLTWWSLPRLWHWLPTDQGRDFAVGADESIGKPVSAGVLFIPLFALISLVVVPFDWMFVEVVLCVVVAMVVGYLDDRAPGGWSEYRLGFTDLVLAFVASMIICQLQPYTLWFPVRTEPVVVSPLVFTLGATPLLWLSINATNCTDGVDGLSASLSGLGTLFLAVILYLVVGHQDVSSYLLVPHYGQGADWAILASVLIGCLAGYLWHNSPPSAVLMGDSGSRPIGLMLGLLVLASGNPFLIGVVAFVLLFNGATGIVKVVLLRFFKIGIFKQIRYPLHDHARHNWGWSNTQVLVRFMLLQAIGTPILLMLLLKVR